MESLLCAKPRDWLQTGVGGGLCEVLAQPVMRPAGKSLRSFRLRIPQS